MVPTALAIAAVALFAFSVTFILYLITKALRPVISDSMRRRRSIRRMNQVAKERAARLAR